MFRFLSFLFLIHKCILNEVSKFLFICTCLSCENIVLSGELAHFVSQNFKGSENNFASLFSQLSFLSTTRFLVGSSGLERECLWHLQLGSLLPQVEQLLHAVLFFQPFETGLTRKFPVHSFYSDARVLLFVILIYRCVISFCDQGTN